MATCRWCWASVARCPRPQWRVPASRSPTHWPRRTHAGLVHRDIKPSNILLSPDGRVQVADFGIAQAAANSAVTSTGITLGSVLYFSPEQARGDMATPASDVYSLGLVMYEMLTGQRAFCG